jgi:hypothetical protein
VGIEQNKRVNKLETKKSRLIGGRKDSRNSFFSIRFKGLTDFAKELQRLSHGKQPFI